MGWNSWIGVYESGFNLLNILCVVGRVCVPIDPKKIDEFDPMAVPTIRYICTCIRLCKSCSKTSIFIGMTLIHVAFQ